MFVGRPKITTKSFKNDVLTWINIDDQLREHRSAIRDLNKKKKEFESQIINYLTEVEEDSIQVKDGFLTVIRLLGKSSPNTLSNNLFERRRLGAENIIV